MTGTVTPPPTDLLDEGRTGWTVWRLMAVLVVLALAGFWIWAFSPWAPSRKADALADASYVERANARCRTANTELAAQEPAAAPKTAAERADRVERANVIVADLVQGLRADAAPATGRDRVLLDQWLDDWDTYFASRERYVRELRTDPTAVFTVPARSGGQITETMDGFSRTNEMFDCLVPLDV
jgi:hypothetical protein